jgi:FkbM family methyltransferase
LGNIISWLRKEEPARVIPILDRFLVILFRIGYIGSYLGTRLFFRFVMGKNRRNKSWLKKKLIFNYEFDIIPVFYYLRFLRFLTKYLRVNKKFLLKLTVPHHDYKVFCPINKNDLLNLTIRENEIIEKFHPKSDEIVIDVGAHYGRYTIIAAKRVGPKGKVVAIEADPKNVVLLNKNIKLNKLNDNVITSNYAVSSKEEKIKLFTPEEDSGSTIYNTIISDRLSPEEKFIEVNANTLDNILQENGIKHDQVNWIKIDVEGAEFEVLKGATGILSKSTDISLLIEIHRISNNITLYNPIMDFLSLYKFEIIFEKVHIGGERHIIMQKKKDIKET